MSRQTGYSVYSCWECQTYLADDDFDVAGSNDEGRGVAAGDSSKRPFRFMLGFVNGFFRMSGESQLTLMVGHDDVAIRIYCATSMRLQ